MTTVFINGCFDLLHVEHVRFIQFAKQQGDRLIVGLNSDESVRYHKGPTRPIIPESERREMLYAVGADDVVIYDEPTPYDVVVARRPAVLVVSSHHGTDCESCRHVRSYGGCVIQSPSFGDLQSTTKIIERIRA